MLFLLNNRLISIHAPREGGDGAVFHSLDYIEISIHAPREGGDHVDVIYRMVNVEFQSTPPARGATSPMRTRG